MAASGGSSSVPSLPPPCPKSPPEYPDLYGKRREMAKVLMLEREIGFLEEELKSVERLQPSSRCCKEVADFVVANSDPLIPTNRKNHRSCRFWRWLCKRTCFNFSWICCYGCSLHFEMPRCNCCDCSCNFCSCNFCSCNLCDCNMCDCNMCNCNSCNCNLCNCHSCVSCSLPKWDCCCWPCLRCFKMLSCCWRSCCICHCPSCPKCHCCRWKCSRPKCPKCPKVRLRTCCNCTKICCNPCCLCY